MATPLRIAIVGCGGSGKSRLARVLGTRLGITPVHLDVLYYDKDWQPLDQETFASLQRELVAAPRWIIDGNYASTLPIRMAAADTVIFLDLPGWACLWGIAARRLRHGGGQHGADQVVVARWQRDRHLTGGAAVELGRAPGTGAGPAGEPAELGGEQSLVDEALDPQRAVVQLAARHRLLVALTEQFVGDVERDDDGEPHDVGSGSTGRRGGHLLLDVGGERGHVLLVESAADWILLSRDVDGDHATGGHGAQMRGPLDGLELRQHVGNTRAD